MAFAVQGSGLWQFKSLTFGMNNGTATFSRLIDSLFEPECQPHVFGYLDDVIVITKTFEEHLQWLEFVLKKLVDVGQFREVGVLLLAGRVPRIFIG